MILELIKGPAWGIIFPSTIQKGGICPAFA